MQGSHTLGKTKKKTSRNAAGHDDYDNVDGGRESDEVPVQTHTGFRTRSRTVGDTADGRRGK